MHGRQQPADGCTNGWPASEPINFAPFRLPPRSLGECEEAFHFRTETEELCIASGRALPDWWISGWRNALYLLDELSARIGAIENWEQIVTELPLPLGF